MLLTFSCIRYAIPFNLMCHNLLLSPLSVLGFMEIRHKIEEPLESNIDWTSMIKPCAFSWDIFLVFGCLCLICLIFRFIFLFVMCMNYHLLSLMGCLGIGSV